MHRYARLIAALDAGLAPDPARTLIADHLAGLPPRDAAWTVRLLGGKALLHPALPVPVLRAAALLASGLPPWLFDLSLDRVGDLAETIALVLDEGPVRDRACAPPGLADWIAHAPQAWSTLQGDAQVERLARDWQALDADVRPVAIGLCAGSRRLRQPAALLQGAVADLAGLPPGVIAQRWDTWTRQADRPWPEAWQALVDPMATDASPTPPPLRPWQRLDLGAAPIDTLARLGPVDRWRVRHHLGGLRVQLVRHRGRARVWGDDLALLDAAFPDLVTAACAWPVDCAIEAELLPGDPAAGLQPRLGRAKVGPALLRRTPVRVRLHDLLSIDGQDLRGLARGQRLQRLQVLLKSGLPSPPTLSWQTAENLPAHDWDEVLRWHRGCREPGAAGLLLSGRDDPLDETWLLPAEPLTARALLLYAQAGTGRHAGRYVDCTLAVWNRAPVDADEARAVIEAIARQEPPAADDAGLRLVTLTRTMVGPDDATRTQVDRHVRAATFMRYGPVRSVRPDLLVELAFDTIEASSRHRSGVTLRAPRMVRLLPDHAPHEAADLCGLLAAQASGSAQP
ncbi:DNA ligase-like domain-containing protein [Leptothrix discophora]|uniref:DNA ligase (ATP) n=1 Tax=Leptothrix discophora TaxID=89 RepID=A0ABT9FZD2_LEPDI|nr:hypothetical protein [Leptothrix discophora]MDP4299593.1 hypothetical protein [Leptothrix discophora]